MAETPKKKMTATKKTTTGKKTTATKTAKTVKKDIKTVEKKMDTAMKSVSKKITPATKQKAQELLNKADAVANKVDDLVDQVDDFANNFLPHGIGSSALFDAERSPTISRLFIFRCLWIVIQYFVIFVRGVWISFLSVLHWIYMLIFGKRERNLRNRQVRFFNHLIKWKAYMMGMTDERPDMITPENK